MDLRWYVYYEFFDGVKLMWFPCNAQVVEAVKGNYLTVAGIETPVLNLGSYDFLNQAENKETKKSAEKTLLKYGVGSCGPRGFYGTIDLHLQFEDEIAKHMGTQVGLIESVHLIFYDDV